MKITVKITNESKFSQVREVDTSDLVYQGRCEDDEKEVFDGGISIHTLEDQLLPFYGLIHDDDFEEDYGFVLDYHLS